MDFKHTPLFDLQLAQNARMVPFEAWEMPVQYKGILAEHQAVRSDVGLFDISHMGKFILKGNLDEIQRLIPSDLSRLHSGEGQYTVLLNEQGGIVDDVIFYCHSPEHWTVIVNASTTEKDKTWIQTHASAVELHDLSQERLLLAIQGPNAQAKLQPYTTIDLSSIPRFGHQTGELLGAESFIARTGYTGEDGFELMLPCEEGRSLWTKLLNDGVCPCGLGCRDTLRLEAGMHLYGQDMSDETTPLEASLGWLVHWDKGPFIGREVLESQKSKLTRKLVGLEIQGRGIPRHDYPVLFQGAPIGTVTSGVLSPQSHKGIALAYVPMELSTLATHLEVDIRGKTVPAMVVKRPFYHRPAV
ncbi:MAG: glycine cleavage system aminomethyltransferase GcvT [Gloeobacterales cyanobacterium]